MKFYFLITLFLLNLTCCLILKAQVITWGDNSKGADSSSVSSELLNGIKNIFSTEHAFAALKDDGSVVTWGNSDFGGDSSNVASELSNGVSSIFSNYNSFAALKDDGSVVTWGHHTIEGSSNSTALELSSGVSTIFSNKYSVFAALKDNGSVIVWGSEESERGGDITSFASELSSGVSTIYSTERAFAALKNDGSVVVWGGIGWGGDEDSSSIASELSSGVISISATSRAFAALKDDGSVVTWGLSSRGGDSSNVASELASGVIGIYSNYWAFAALKDDGSVVTWGASAGGDSSGVAPQLSSGVNMIYPSHLHGFTALKSDGSVVTWPATNNSPSVNLSLSNGVSTVYSTWYAYAAIKDDGSVVTWGDNNYGGDSTNVASELSNGVSSIYSTRYAFAALKEDGSVVTWGSNSSGGDSNMVASELSSGVSKIYSNDHAFAAIKFSDSDEDGVGDNADAFPNDPNEWLDTDGDGVGDNTDAFPNDPADIVDTDGDGLGDNSETNIHFTDPNLSDTDGDGVLDGIEVLIDLTDPNNAEEYFYLSQSTSLLRTYALDNNAYDISGNEEHGTLASEITLSKSRHENLSSIDFQNDQYLSVPSINNENLTISFHYKPNLNYSYTSLPTFIDSMADKHHLMFRKRLTDFGGWNRFGFWETGYVDSDLTPDDNNWMHIVLTISANEWQLYCNGVLINEVSSVFDNTLFPVNGFGNANVNFISSVEGSLDDIKVFNRVLEAGEIKDLYEFEAPNWLLINGSFTWEQAYEDAISKNGRLAVLDSQEKVNAALAYLDKVGSYDSTWIGASDKDEENIWKWINGNLLEESNPNWKGEEGYTNTNNNPDIEDYLIIWASNNGYDGKFADTSNDTPSVRHYLFELNKDLDGDSLYNFTEEILGTDPHDADSDNDTYLDANDAFPLDASEWLDTDGDGLGNNTDSDDDNDGLLDIVETNTGIWVDINDTGTDPKIADSDGDRLSDREELSFFSTPYEIVYGSYTYTEALLDAVDKGGYVARTREIDEFAKLNRYLNTVSLDEIGSYSINRDGAPTGAHRLWFSANYSDADNRWEWHTRPPSHLHNGQEPGHTLIWDLGYDEWLDVGNQPAVMLEHLQDNKLSYLGISRSEFPYDWFWDSQFENEKYCYILERNTERLVLEGKNTDPNNADTDGDGVGDNADTFPNDPTETTDTDDDGVGDNADAFPSDPTETIDTDGDGVGDNAEVNTYSTDPNNADSDNDGLADADEVNIHLTNPLIKDTNSDGLNDGIAVSLGMDPNTNNTNLINYISNNLEEFDIETADYTQAEYDIAITTSRSDGQNDVLNNPNNYNLFSLEEVTTVYGVEESVYDDLLESRDNAIAEKNSLQANLNEYENYELPRIDINDVLTTWLGYVYDPVDDVHKVDPNVDVDQNKLQYLAHFRGILDEGPLSEELKDDVLLGLRVAINHKISREYWKARAKSQPTQAQYESAIAATNTGYTLEEIRDLRPGSSLLEIVDGKANIIMEVEESDDLNIWTTGGTASIELPIEAGSEKKFYRFKMSNESSGTDNDIYNNSVFSVIEGNFTWEEARLDAESRGGRLAVLDTQEKIDTVNAMLNEFSTWPHLWIGLNTKTPNYNWQWIDGTSLTVANWDPAEPSNEYASQGLYGYGFIYMKPFSKGPGLWDDTGGSQSYSYLLETPAP